MLSKTLKSSILFFTAIHISAFLNGQPAIQPVVPSVPTSPQAEAFKKYGEFEINYSTGIPDISIPLFEINHRGYHLPMTLKYNPQPLHPGYNYDVYGHCWGLSVSSCVSRTIEYIPDEWKDFQLETNKLSDEFKKDLTDFTSINLGYDKFNVVLPDGSSFDFIMRKADSKLRYTVSNNRSVLISCSYNSTNINSFTIVDEQGITYTFDGADTPYRGGNTTKFGSSYVSWQLTSIKLPHSTEKIVFSYGTMIESNFSRYIREATVLFRHDLESRPTKGSVYQVFNAQPYFYRMKLLTSISYGSTNINLTYQKKTAKANYNYVDEIKITDHDNLIRNIKLDKSIHTYSYSGNPNDSIAKLNKITISGGSSQPMVYQCRYTSNGGYFAGTDHWGFLNTSDTQNSVGRFNFFIGFNYQDIAVAPVAIAKLNKSPEDVCPYDKVRISYNSSDNRAPLGPISHGVLDILIYPTGGYTKFIFENHQFLTATDANGNYIHNKNHRRPIAAAGFRIKKVINYTSNDSIADVKHYCYGKIDNKNNHSGLGEAVVDPNILTYANYTSGTGFPLRYMLLGLNTNGQLEPFNNPFEFGTSMHSVWGWECTFSAENFRKILDGRTPVIYSEVTVYHGDIYADQTYSPDKTVGKTVYKYDIYDIMGTDTMFFERPQYYGNCQSYSPKKYRYNILTEKTDYMYEYQRYRVIRTEKNEWIKNYQYEMDYQYKNAYHTDHVPANTRLYSFFETKNYYLGGVQLRSRKTISYDHAAYGVTQSDFFNYNIRNQLTEKLSTDNSQWQNVKTIYTYPEISTTETTPAVIQEMVNKNIISPVLEEKSLSTLLTGTSTFTDTGGAKVEYQSYSVGSSTLYQPSKVYELNVNGSTSSYVASAEILSYSEQGNPREVISKDGVHTVYLWSYDDRYMIAEIKNATSVQVSAAVSAVFGMTVDALSRLASPDVTKLKSLRKNSNLANAFVSTFTYQPLIGVTSMTDPAGLTVYYSYDGLGRLTETYYYEGNAISADKKRTLQQYEYHYRNQ